MDLKEFLKKVFIEKDNEHLFLLYFLFLPYLVGLPIYYLATDSPQHYLIEVFAPWFVGLICIPSVLIFVALIASFGKLLYNVFNELKNKRDD